MTYAVAVQLLDQALEFTHTGSRPLVRRVARLGREEVDRAVAPVVLHPVARAGIDVRVLVLVELVEGKEFDRRYAKVREIGNLLAEAVVGAGVAHAGVPAGREALQVDLIDDAVAQGPVDWPVALPVKGLVVYDDALGELVEVAGLLQLHVRLVYRGTVVRGQAVEHGGRRNRLGVGIKEQLLDIEAVALAGLKRPVHPVEIQGPRLEARHEDMPDVARPVPNGVKLQGGIRIVVPFVRIQFQYDPCPIPAENGKVDPAVPYMSAEGIGIPRQTIFQRH